MHRTFHPRKRVLAAALLACLCSWGALAASARKVECAQIVIQNGSEELVLELPLQVLEALRSRAPAELEVGTVAGSAVKVTCDGLLTAVRDKKAKSDDGYLLVTLDSRQGPLSLSVRRVERKVSEIEGSPSGLLYTTKEKEAKVSAKVKVTFEALDQFAGNFSGNDGADPDFGPLIRACLSVAKDVDQGPLLRIVNRDVEQGFVLE